MVEVSHRSEQVVRLEQERYIQTRHLVFSNVDQLIEWVQRMTVFFYVFLTLSFT